MKQYVFAAIVALAATSTALAGGREVTYSSSIAGAAAEAAANANSASNSHSSVVFNTPANTHSRVSGTTTVRSAPQVVAPSMSSGHPCAFAPVSIGVSVVGFGGAFGGQRIDDACLLAQMQVRNAAISMIAARNPQACAALEANGIVSGCGGRRTVSAYSGPTQVVSYAKPNRRTVARAGGQNCRQVFATATTTKKVCD